METKNSCYTYFTIVGDFEPDRVSDLLGLKPEKSWKIGDLRRNGTAYDFARWTIGRCDEYDAITANQMRKTIAPLLDKIGLLNMIQKENAVSFCLEIVPSVYAGGIHPCLAPTLDVIDFCHATRTEIDIDLYVYDSEEI
ncbi:MAG: DUF4279 domain-containing protein [Clostridia bacterium]|nr:DUF4279 domain-containing protein [Clostridia bacterium]